MGADTKGEDSMDTRQLLTFITLSETLNYPRAAERLQYAPSTLHRHIELLEEELGTPLFDKAGRQLFLTDEGRRLLPEAKAAYEKCADFLSSARREKKLSISIGGCELNTAYALRDFLQKFAQFGCTGPAAQRGNRPVLLLQPPAPPPAGALLYPALLRAHLLLCPGRQPSAQEEGPPVRRPWRGPRRPLP